jgi:hypothetical protein
MTETEWQEMWDRKVAELMALLPERADHDDDDYDPEWDDAPCDSGVQMFRDELSGYDRTGRVGP